MSFNIWNNLDETALYLGLERLDSETNESFNNRIREFGKWKYKTDYLSQVHSISLQLGLSVDKIVKLRSDYDFECKLDWEYFTLENSQEYLRVFIGELDSRLYKILNVIDNSSTFRYTLYSNPASATLCKFLVRNSNVKVYQDYLVSNRYNLRYKNIIPGSITCSNRFLLRNEKLSIPDLKKDGDYFVDYKNGYIELFYPDFNGEYITYKHYDTSFYLESTELNLSPMNNITKYGITDELINNIPYLLNNRVWD